MAFSGGVDSTFLLSVAKEVLDNRVIAATVASSLQPRHEAVDASRIARKLGVKHTVFHIDVLSAPRIRKNSRNRCYYCKMFLMKKLKDLATRKNYVAIEATNKSDLKDHRPGLSAVKQLGIKSPLIEAGFEKEEIRRAARRRGLPNWSKPSTACLASRIPYGELITAKRLMRIEEAEEYLKRLGFTQVRLRDHFPIARIEINPREFDKLMSLRQKILRRLRRLKYKHITLDLDGYRTGSLNP